jgi:hypothetical protein
MWGFGESQTTRYLEISRLSETFKKKYLKPSPGKVEQLDVQTAAQIATVDWDDGLKEEAAEELSKITS